MMEIFSIALVVTSLFTSLMTEAVKKILDEFKIKYLPNILAAIMSIFVSIAVIEGYILFTGIAVTNQIIVQGVTLVVLSFLCATVGYDKVIQTINQAVKK